MSVPNDYRLAKMKLKHGHRSVTVSIEAVDGLIYTLKYYSSPKSVVTENFDIVETEYGGKRDESIVRSIEREEHGDEFS